MKMYYTLILMMIFAFGTNAQNHQKAEQHERLQKEIQFDKKNKHKQYYKTHNNNRQKDDIDKMAGEKENKYAKEENAYFEKEYAERRMKKQQELKKLAKQEKLRIKEQRNKESEMMHEKGMHPEMERAEEHDLKVLKNKKSTKTTKTSAPATKGKGLSHGVEQQDYEALIALYNSTKGASWTNSLNWNTDTDVSTWYGVTVSGGRVTEVILETNNLAGTIPTEIGNLTNITAISLYNNQLINKMLCYQ